MPTKTKPITCYFRVRPDWRHLTRFERKNEYARIESTLSQCGLTLVFFTDGFSDSDTGFMLLQSDNEWLIQEDVINLLDRHYPTAFIYLDFL